MSKPFPYWIRLFVVSTLSILLTFNPVFAGRLLSRTKCSKPTIAACKPTPCCPPAQEIAACAPIECASVEPDCGCGQSEAVVVTPSSGCDVPVADTCCDMTVPMESSPPNTTESTVTPLAPAAPGEAAPMIPEPAPSILPEVSPIAPEPAKVPPPKPEPSPEPAPSPFSEPPTIVPTDDATEAELPMESEIFLDEEMSTEEPSLVPQEDDAADLPATTDDFFGEPTPEVPGEAIEPVPMDDVAPDSAPTVDDLFDDSALEPMADPVSDADAEPDASSDLNDLFGTDPAPADPAPASDSDLNDLFNFNDLSTPESSVEEPSDETAITTVVSTRMDSQESFERTGYSDIDALFGTPIDAEQKNTEQQTADPIGDSDFEDLFKTTSGKAAAIESFRGAEFRNWTDDTGEFSVSARLSVIFPDRIRLLKENGKYSTVSVDRLSAADRQYVGWVAMSLQKTTGTKLVNTQMNPASVSAEVTR